MENMDLKKQKLQWHKECFFVLDGYTLTVLF